MTDLQGRTVVLTDGFAACASAKSAVTARDHGESQPGHALISMIESSELLPSKNVLGLMEDCLEQCR